MSRWERGGNVAFLQTQDAWDGFPGCGWAQLPWQPPVVHACGATFLSHHSCPGRSLGFVKGFTSCQQNPFTQQQDSMFPFRGQLHARQQERLGWIGLGWAGLEQGWGTHLLPLGPRRPTGCQDTLCKPCLSSGACLRRVHREGALLGGVLGGRAAYRSPSHTAAIPGKPPPLFS